MKSLLLLAMSLAFCTTAAAGQGVLVEAESFARLGGWVIDPQFMDVMGSPYLLAHGLGRPVADATTEAEFPAPGSYRVWVRTKDWVAPWHAAGTPGRFQLLVNGKPLETVFGTEGATWHWQDGGRVQIPARHVPLALHDLTGFEGRCDAVFFTADLNFSPPNEGPALAAFRRQCRGLPEQPEPAGDFDFVVTGGGMAGTCAALSAARSGLSVALIQDRPVLGGNNSSEVRVWLQGARNKGPWPRIGDVVAELEPVRRAHYGAANAAELYEDEKKLAVVRGEPKIHLFLEHRVNAAEAAAGRIRAVIAEDIRSGRRLRIAGRWFADCTGDGAVGVLAGADFEMSAQGHMGPCNLWNVCQCDDKTALGTTVDAGRQPAAFPRCPWALDLADKPFPGRDKRKPDPLKLGGWYWESGFDRDPILEMEAIRDWNFRAMYGAWDAMKNVDKVLPNYQLHWSAYILGKRESRRLLGDIVLSIDDLKKDRSFADGCVPTGWSNDLHDPDPRYEKGFAGEAFISEAHFGQFPAHEEGRPYWIPYRCLYSRNVSNLFMAGRDLSVKHEALGAVRVMRTCGCMGEVVGMAASVCKRHNASPRAVYEEYWNELADLLRRGAGKSPGSNPHYENQGERPAKPRLNNWAPAGWGGGGFYYSAVFHPTDNGVIYMGGDVNGVYKSIDQGKSWRIINNGISGYGVFALAVDPGSPNTVWAATDEGLSKSTNAGETWRTIPNSGPKELRLTGEKNRSIHNVAVDPANGNVVYVGTPHGKIYKTSDGGETWTRIYQRVQAAEPVASMRMQLGNVNDAIFGGLWMPLKFPETISAAAVTGIGFSVKSEGARPRDVFFTLRTSTGYTYQSRNLHDDFAAAGWHDIVLSGADFIVDPDFKSKEPEKAAQAPATPDWPAINRFDFVCVAGFEADVAVIHMSRIFFAATKTADAETATAKQPVKVTAVDLSTAKFAPVYGNLRTGEPGGGPIYSVAVSPQEPKLVAAASADEGLLLSRDAGKTWHAAGPMRQVASLAFTAADPNIIYAACMKQRIWKSSDKGATWTIASMGIAENIDVRDIVVSTADPNDVSAIGSQNWGGCFLHSADGGRSWSVNAQVTPDPLANPTLPAETGNRAPVALSAPRNLAINPQNPRQLFIAANWRSAISNDGGRTWFESTKGADISCVTDIRFLKNRVYVSNMDEGVLVTADNGATWKQLWPLRYANEVSGHFWRLDVRQIDGNVRILSTSSPWDRQYNQVVVSHDDGKTFQVSHEGLPDYLPTANSMWGRAYARALAVDPSDPRIVYMGMDGDPTPGKSGGGIFKSADGGQTWKQLANQPGSRRVFFGLAIDPTNPQRVYWGASGDKGGVYRSDGGGGTWQRVFSQEQWIFNLHVTADGTVYCLGNQVYRSTDQGKTWKRLAKLPGGGVVVGFEVHPTDPNTLWAAADYWGGPASLGGVFKTTDGGKTWSNITGNLPYRRPLILRFNPQTSELWAGYVGLYRIQQ